MAKVWKYGFFINRHCVGWVLSAGANASSVAALDTSLDGGWQEPHSWPIPIVQQVFLLAFQVGPWYAVARTTDLDCHPPGDIPVSYCVCAIFVLIEASQELIHLECRGGDQQHLLSSGALAR